MREWGRERGRTAVQGAAIAIACLLITMATALPARADKKKPGLFDFDTWKLPSTREREAAKDLAPGSLDVSSVVTAGGPPRVIRLRIYADRDYRSVVLRWQSKARAQVNRINAVLQPVFNAAFEIESLRDWDRSHMGIAMTPVLDELAKFDAANEVDLVIGLVTPLTGVATTAHAIGQARLLSRHFILRGMDDEQEGLALDREFSLLSKDEREKLYVDRKAHKEVVMFLHEWGHTVGLLHREQVSDIMNPRYDPKQSAFSEYENRVVALILDRRSARRPSPTEPFPEMADLVSLLEAAPTDEGSDKDRAELLALARARLRGQNEPRAGGKADAGDLARDDVTAFNRAVEAANAGRGPEAWAELAPVLARAGTGKTAPKTWARLAELASAIGALSAAEDAAARGGDAPGLKKLSSHVALKRQQMCLPREATRFGVEPGNEPAYVARFLDAERAVSSAEVPAARDSLRAFAQAYPEAPAVDLLTCHLELRARRLPAASKRCEAAVSKFKESGRAHYLAGVVAASGGKDAAAEQHLQKAIALDPTDDGSWRMLARMYRQSRSSRRLAELAARHQALLSSPLPTD